MDICPPESMTPAHLSLQENRPRQAELTETWVNGQEPPSPGLVLRLEDGDHSEGVLKAERGCSRKVVGAGLRISSRMFLDT